MFQSIRCTEFQSSLGKMGHRQKWIKLGATFLGQAKTKNKE